jgi:hypothetical protein
MSIIHPFLISKGEKPPVPGTGHRLRFFDYDGTLLKTQYVETGNNATAPIMPDYSIETEDRPALIFQTLSGSLYNIQKDIDFGAIYKTADGKTYLYIELTPTTGLSPSICIDKLNTNEMTIDWGDETIETNSDSGNITLNHTYANYGKYKIRISFTGTVVNFKLGHNSDATSLFAGSLAYSASLKGLYIGDNISTLQNYALDYCINLTKITIPTLVNSLGTYCFRNCYSLPFIITPYLATLVNVGVFQNCYSLSNIILSAGIEKIGNSAISNNFSLKDIIFPDGLTTFNNYSMAVARTLRKITVPASVTTLGTQVFYSAVNMLYYKFLSTTPPTMANINVFENINILCKIYVPDASLEAYKTATNWSVYADYIYPLSEFEEVE